jgi:hypothetical protein
MKQKLLILTNKPKEEYQYLCHKLIKRYCFINNYELNFVDEYSYNKKYDYIIYIDNRTLILNLEIKLDEFIINENNITGYRYLDILMSSLICIKNNKKNKLFIEKLKFNERIKYINDYKLYPYNNYLSDNKTKKNNESLYNKDFIEYIKKSNVFFYTENNSNIKWGYQTPKEILNYLYLEIFNRFYNNKIYKKSKIDYNKFNCDGEYEEFNPNNEIAFVSLYTHHIRDEGKEMEYNLKNYCLKNNYTFHIYRTIDLNGKHPCLAKPILLEKHILNHKYIIWVDSDILILEQTFKIENLLNKNYDLISYNDIDINVYFNSGFLIFKNSKNSLKIIKEWSFDIERRNAKVIHGPTHGDQGVLNDIIKNNNDYNIKTLINNNDIFNTPLVNHNKNTIVLHLMGQYGITRQILMKYFNDKIFEKIKNIPLDERFTDIYINNKWMDKESKSGRGSTIKATEIIRKELPLLFERYDIKKLIDTSCGDFNWMKLIVNKLEYYKGLDVVKKLIDVNNEKYSTDKINFEYNDIIKNFNFNKNDYDAILCRDTFVHLFFDDIHKSLNNFKNSGIKYLIMTHYNEYEKNYDFDVEHNLEEYNMWRPINFTIEPFNFPNPLYSIEEKEGYYNKNKKACFDKTLSIWKIN